MLRCPTEMAWRVYVSGPMSGHPDLNAPAFIAAATWLRSLGHTVLNPAEFGFAADASWESCMREDIRALMTCDAIVLLPGWKKSKGASIEAGLAESLKILIYELDLNDMLASPGGLVQESLLATITTLLSAALLMGEHVHIKQYGVSFESDADWVFATNPYGVDVPVLSGRPEVAALLPFVREVAAGALLGPGPTGSYEAELEQYGNACSVPMNALMA